MKHISGDTHFAKKRLETINGSMVPITNVKWYDSPSPNFEDMKRIKDARDGDILVIPGVEGIKEFEIGKPGDEANGFAAKSITELNKWKFSRDELKAGRMPIHDDQKDMLDAIEKLKSGESPESIASKHAEKYDVQKLDEKYSRVARIKKPVIVKRAG